MAQEDADDETLMLRYRDGDATAFDQQHLQAPTGQRLQAGAGMQVAVEIHQGRRTVLEYLLSPVSKAVQEAGREK